jgi:hypothetical protein
MPAGRRHAIHVINVINVINGIAQQVNLSVVTPMWVSPVRATFVIGKTHVMGISLLVTEHKAPQTRA